MRRAEAAALGLALVTVLGIGSAGRALAQSAVGPVDPSDDADRGVVDEAPSEAESAEAGPADVTVEAAPSEGTAPAAPADPEVEVVPELSIDAAAVEAPAGSIELSSGPDDDVQVTFGPTSGLVVDVPSLGAHLEFHFATWVRAQLDVPPNGDADPNFDVPLARPLLRGSLFHDKVRFLLQPELAGANPRLLDVQLDFVLDDAFVISVGQFRTPFARSYITPIVLQTFPDRGLVSDTFRLDRDTGLMISGHTPARMFEYAAGIFNGARIDGRLGDLPSPTAIARVVLNLGAPVPYGQSPGADRAVEPGVAIGLGGAYRRWRFPENDPAGPEESARLGVDLTIAAGPFSFTAEGYLNDTRTEVTDWDLSWGAFAQAGVLVLPWLELAARGSWLDPSVGLGGNFIQIYEGGLNFYPVVDDLALGHHLKASLRYGWESAGAAFGNRVVEGERHRLTLQVQLLI